MFSRGGQRAELVSKDAIIIRNEDDVWRVLCAALIAVLKKVMIEVPNDDFDIVAKLREQWDDFRSLQGPDFVKRYVSGEIVLGFEFRCVPIGGVGNPLHLFAIFDVPMKRGAGIGSRQMDRDVNATSVDFDDRAEAHGDGGHDKKLVFVANVEVVDHFDRVIGWRRRMVRLKSFYDRMTGPRDALHYPAVRGLFEFLPRITHRELRSEVGSRAVSLGERPNHMIKGTSQMVNDLTGDDSDTQWNWGADAAKEVTLPSRLVLSNDCIRITAG